MFKTFNLFRFTHIVSERKQPYNPKVYPWLANSQVYKYTACDKRRNHDLLHLL